MTQTTNKLTFDELSEYHARVAYFIDKKGYSGLVFRAEINIDNDEVQWTVYFYNTEFSSTHLPSGMVRCSLSNARKTLDAIIQWVRELPNEGDAREQALLADYARIKERIARSNLSDLVKEEAAALLKRMSTNILEYQKPPVVHEHIDF